MEPNEVPPCGPGQTTTSPTDVELYFRGYLEVPKNCNGVDCGPHGAGGPLGPGYDELPAGGKMGPPMPPAAAGARRTPTTSAKGYAGGGGARPSGAIGSGTPARPVSTTRGSDSQQDAYSSYYGSGSPQKPSATSQPALIGPLGYDDLK
jgi:pilus assembly protein CpaC